MRTMKYLKVDKPHHILQVRITYYVIETHNFGIGLFKSIILKQACNLAKYVFN